VKVLGLTSNITIPAQAIAKVNSLQYNPCVLALSGPITFHDSAVTVDAPTCGLASNSTGVMTYMPPVTDPFVSLDTALNALNTSLWKACSGLTAYSASKPCYNSGGGTITTSGVCFFSGPSLSGHNSLATASGVQATIILLPGTSLRMVGGTSISIAAQSSVPTSELPTGLQSVASLLSDVAFYDTESGTPKINGNPTITFEGVFYAPNMNLTFKGHPTMNPVNNLVGGSKDLSCYELFAASVEFIGSPTFVDSGCSPSIEPVSQVVTLVQ
jgi:hypothetical protein